MMTSMKPRAFRSIKPLVWCAVVCASLAMWLVIGWLVLTAMVVGG